MSWFDEKLGLAVDRIQMLELNVGTLQESVKSLIFKGNKFFEFAAEAEAFRRGMKFADDQAYLKNEAEFKRGYDQGKVDGRDEGVCEATADATAAYERRLAANTSAFERGRMTGQAERTLVYQDGFSKGLEQGKDIIRRQMQALLNGGEVK